MNTSSKKKKLYTVKIRSKNYSVDNLRGHIKLGFRSLVRFGSTTPTNKIWPKSYNKDKIVEINTVEAVENSRSKLKMKECFVKAEVPQSKWFVYFGFSGLKDTDPNKKHRFYYDPENTIPIEELPFPIVAKRVFGFKGQGMAKLNNREELEEWLNSHKNLNGWYYEEFKNYSREYRLHCTKNGCFYAARKMLTSDIPEEKRWYRNDSNCVWITEYEVARQGDVITSYNTEKENEMFDKPSNWEEIVNSCIKALEATTLDIGAFDVKVQSATTSKGTKRDNPKYIIIEVNSAPAFGIITNLLYKKELIKLLREKYENSN